MKLCITHILLNPKKNFLIIFLSLCICGNKLLSQDNIKFIRLFENQSISGVTDMFQDKRGIVWIGTSNGLFTYDGLHLTQYINNFNDKSSISDNFIRKIIQDSKGKIWIATSYGLNLYDIEKDNFIHYFHDEKDTNSIPDNFVTSITEDLYGNIWVAAKYLCRYNRDKNNFTTFKTFLGDRYASMYKSYYTLLLNDKQDNLWFCTWDRLYIFNKADYSFKVFLSIDELKGSHEKIFKSLTQDRLGQYWMLLDKSGLFSFDFTDRVINIKEHDYAANSAVHIRNFSTSQVKEDNNGNLWIGTENGGAFRYNIATGHFSNYLNDINNETTISNNSIWSIFLDNIGRTWLGHHVRGISVIDPYYEKFYHVKSGTNQKKLSNNDVAALLAEDNGNLWIATDGGGLNYYNKQKGEYTHYMHQSEDPGSISKDAVISLCKDINGNLWIGTWDGGINILKKGQNSFTKLNTKNSVLENNSIYALISDNKGKIYIGTYGSGLYIHDVNTGKWENYKHNNYDSNSLVNNYIFSLFVDKGNNIWIGTFNSGADLLQFDESGKARFTHFQFNRKDSQSLSNNYVQTFFEEEDGTFWIGTRNGLNKLNKNQKNFKIYRTENGLPNNSIKAILDDTKGNLWISTLQGISKFDKLKESFRNYSIEDGLQGNIFHRNSASKSKSGHMYFGGANGFNFFHPDSIKDNPYPPQILFVDFKIFNKTVPISENSVLKKHINETKEITLNYKQTVFTIEFVALNLTHPEKNQYAFMLKGFETDWNYVGTQNSATYTNLDPGSYVFRVKASNNDGIWNEEGISIIIHITPPFWKTWWFRIGIVLFIIVISAFVVIKRINFLKKQKVLLEDLVNKRTEELVESNRQLEESLEEINIQKEQLDSQNEYLQSTNKTLEENKKFIIRQNIELDKYRHHLEQMVEERTKELSTALKKADESDKLKNAFLANISHEVRTPMNAIMGFSSLLSDSDLSDEEKKECSEMIRKNGESLLFLINEIIDLSKIQTQQLAIYLKPANIPLLLDEIHKSAAFTANQKKLALILSKDCISDDFSVVTDSLRIKQIFSNLISNAIKYTEEGTVEFGIKPPVNDYITFYVKDTGIGISKDADDKLFGLFNKIDISKKTLYRGIGIGLPLCKNLTELLGGKIWYESEESKGSVFYFTIPNQQENGSPANVPDIADELELKGKTVLIAEDQESNYKLLAFYLQSTGATIKWFENGEAIVNYIKDNGVADVILMDIKMPIMDGLTATMLIKEIRKDLPIIIQTAYTAIEKQVDIEDKTQSHFITKPINRNELFALLKKVLNMEPI